MALRDRLDAARRDRFIGRADELELFRRAVTARALPFHVLAVHGPGGVGKSSLLQAYARLCEQHFVAAHVVDARGIDGPEAFEQAAAPLAAFGYAGGDGAPVQTGRRVLLVDHAEAVRPLEPWLREVFLPQIDEEVLVVLAGRHAPEPAWTTDLGWEDELVVLPLRNFTPDESAAFLAAHGVPAEQHAAVARATHGHPMALALVAERAAQHPDRAADAARSPDVVRTLLERFLAESPTAAHRAAVEAAAVARTLTEPLLEDLLPGAGVQTLFAWLRGLSFVSSAPDGLVLHDLAREVVGADLRWRAPDRFAALHERARRHFTDRLREAGAEAERQHVLAEYVHLYRDNPVVAPLFGRLREEWQRTGALQAGPMRPEDRPTVTALVEHHEGAESARWAAAWLREGPHHAEAFRTDDGLLAGFLLPVLFGADEPDRPGAGLGGAPPLDDPALVAARAHLRQHAPLRGEERALLFRFWMDAEAYQSVSASQSTAFARTVRFYLGTPHLAFSFIPCADPELWGDVFQFAGLQPLPDAAFVVGGRTYHVFGHDWREEPPEAWLTALAGRIPDAAPPPRPPESERLVVLSRPDFAEAVAEALRDFVRPQRLAGTPLLRSRLVASQADDEAERIDALLGLLEEAAGSLAQAPREAPYYRALRATYFQPARTQALAAEAIGVPFSTYRRHLKRGVERVVEALWQREVAG